MLSKINFVWVLRPDIVSSDDPDLLPNELKEEVRGRSIIIPWCCQLQCWRIRRKLVVDDWKVGINISDGESIARGEVSEKINHLMGGKSGDELRERMDAVKQTLGKCIET
ncbi:UDP-glycosyltransferase 86A2 [Vitis vinifera]|uniref:UDP-glycosyltransferase 86A2 n=1 Tax=Vitis vinifera TaxID=29760 RepID=A0A438C2P1_VITVI|nr:UDP-glycosyltransferase 86A2 [Vitis vinifera]